MDRSVADLLKVFETLHPKTIDLSLDRINRLLTALGEPQAKLPPVIHVAGTNGKGSVVAYLRAFLEAAGYRVHSYTSPHLVRFNERIVLAGTEISDDQLAEVLAEVEKANEGKPITFFEATTAAAFLAMSRVEADVTILETGLGGRLDATNVVKRPALTVLTPISLDHTEYLGGHIEAVAAEKSFTIKAGVPCVSAKQDKKTSRIIEMRSLEMGAPTYREGEDWYARTTPRGIIYEGKTVQVTLPEPSLVGAHQLRNAALAVAATEKLKGFSVSPSALAVGMRAVRWPGRLERLDHGPLLDALPSGWEIWLDGGHNPAAAKVLVHASRSFRGKDLHMVIGMTGQRDPAGFVKPFGPRVHSLRAVPVPDAPESVEPAAIAEAARKWGVRDPGEAADPAEAVAAIVEAAKAAPRPGVILITGSLYLVGQVLREAAG